MDWLKQNYDRAIVIVISLLALWISVTFILKALGFAENFALPVSTPGAQVPPTPQPEIEGATETLTVESFWIAPRIGELPSQKQPSLFLSVPIVEKDGEIFDMSDEAKPLRAPASNAWLVENSLDFLRTDVLTLDPDGDGFSNIEEWEGKSEPDDRASAPSLLSKLKFVNRRQEDYVLIFASNNDPDFGINKEVPPPRENWFVKVGETFAGGRFKLTGFEKKSEVNNLGVTQDRSTLDITDLQKGQQFQLVRGIRNNLPTYFAVFRFNLGDPEEIDVKLGETFKLPQGDPTTYKVIEVSDDNAMIENVPEPGSGVPATRTLIKKEGE